MPPILTVEVEKDGRKIKINADQTIEYALLGWTRVTQPTAEQEEVEAEAKAELDKEKAEAEAEAKEAEEKNRQVEAENQAKAKALEDAKAEAKVETPVEDVPSSFKALSSEEIFEANSEKDLRVMMEAKEGKVEPESKEDTLVVD